MTTAKVSQPATYLKAILAGLAAGASALAGTGTWWAGLAAAVGAFNLVFWPGNSEVRRAG